MKRGCTESGAVRGGSELKIGDGGMMGLAGMGEGGRWGWGICVWAVGGGTARECAVEPGAGTGIYMAGWRVLVRREVGQAAERQRAVRPPSVRVRSMQETRIASSGSALLVNTARSQMQGRTIREPVCSSLWACVVFRKHEIVEVIELFVWDH